MKIAIAFVLFAICAMPPRACPQSVPAPGQQEPSKPEESCAIEGSVVSANTGEPLKKVHLELYAVAGARPQPYIASTDADGHFRFKDVEPGRYRLAAGRNGYLDQRYGEDKPQGAGALLTLAPGQVLSDIRFRLIRGGVIAGRVTDEDGEPLAHVHVSVLTYAYQGGRRRLITVGMPVETDDLGQYRIFELPPRRYFLAVARGDLAQAPPQVSGQGAPTGTGYVPLYFPGVTDPAQASPIVLRSGEERRGADFTLTLVHVVAVKGRVVDPVSGHPPRGAWVMLNPRNSGEVTGAQFGARALDSQGGRFEIRGVGPGSYVLSAVATADGRQLNARMPVEVGDSDLDGLELVFAPLVEVRGALRVEGETRFDPRQYSIHVSLRAVDDASESAGVTSRGSGAGSDSFFIPGVRPGKYYVSVMTGMDSLYLKQVRMGDADVLDNGVDLAPGSPPVVLDIVLSADGGRVDGTVKSDDDTLTPQAIVVLVPEKRRRSRTELFKTTTTDQFGKFRLEGIAPGEYKLFAWQQIEQGAWEDPELLAPLEESATTVTVKEKSRQSLELKPLPNPVPADAPQ